MYSESTSSNEHFFFSSVNSTGSLKLKVRLWNPADWLRGHVKIYLSILDVNVDRDEIEKWKSGIEILVSHLGSGILSKTVSILLHFTGRNL